MSGLTRRRSSAKKEQVELLKDQPQQKKWHNALVRSLYGLIMLVGFSLVLYAGHASAIFLVYCVQTAVYFEVISIGIEPSKTKGLPWFRSLHWYFLFSTNYFLYGESLLQYNNTVLSRYVVLMGEHHRFFSFLLYMLGFVVFVLNLRKGHYKFQFTHFCWTHMALLLIICQSHFIINNIFEGMFWFVFPASLVIVNDSMAYVFGFFFGRTPLIRVSPKKTWEGFIGGFFSTMLFAFYVSRLLASTRFMTDTYSCVNGSGPCSTNPVFIADKFSFGPIELEILPIQLHALLFGAFASLIAPFGGFFASGVKRAFNIKDFSDSIPGHGGLTDRMDCQFLMGVFSHMYLTSFLLPKSNFDRISGLSDSSLLELYYQLQAHLIRKGILTV